MKKNKEKLGSFTTSDDYLRINQSQPSPTYEEYVASRTESVPDPFTQEEEYFEKPTSLIHEEYVASRTESVPDPFTQEEEYFEKPWIPGETKVSKKTSEPTISASSIKSVLSNRYKKKSPQEAYNFIDSMHVEVKLNDAPILPSLNLNDASDPADREMCDAIKDSLSIFREHDRTIVYAVIVAKDKSENAISALRCFGGIALGCYPRNTSADAYLVECVAYANIGSIPFGISVGDCRVKIPIPTKVLEKSFTPDQRKAVQELKAKYNDNYEIIYLQMLGANL